MSDEWTTFLSGDARFPMTRLSLVLRACDTDPTRRREAQGVLFGAYWKPLYAFLRARGVPSELAKDFVQSFCAAVIEKGLLSKFDPARGRLRTFLLVCLKSMVRDEGRLVRVQEVPLAANGAPSDREGREPTPDAAYDHSWALSVIERAFERWKTAMPGEGKQEWLPIVELLEKHGYGNLPPVADLAQRLGVSEARVRHFLHRDAKARLRREVLAEVREGTGSDEDAAEEVDYLMRCIRSAGEK